MLPLTALRLFAASLIVVDHAFTFVLAHPPEAALYQGVTFFFVLSGFILSHNYSGLRSIEDAKRFWWTRFARIWPLTMLSGLVCLITLPEVRAAYLSWDGAPKLLAYALLVQGFIPLSTWQFAVSSVAWSLSSEAFFYLCFPFLIRNLEASKSWKLLGTLFLPLCIAMATWTSGLPTYASLTQLIAADQFIYTFPPARLFEFMLGIYAWSLWRSGWFLHIGRREATLVEVLLLLVICLQMFFLTQQWYEWTSPFAPHLPNSILLWLERSGSAPLYGLLLIVFAEQRGAISAWLRNRWLVLGGEISFAIYLFHQPILRLMYQRREDILALPALAVWTAYGCVCLLLSYVLWRGFEIPVRRLLLRSGGVRHTPTVPSR